MYTTFMSAICNRLNDYQYQCVLLSDGAAYRAAQDDPDQPGREAGGAAQCGDPAEDIEGGRQRRRGRWRSVMLKCPCHGENVPSLLLQSANFS